MTAPTFTVTTDPDTGYLRVDHPTYGVVSVMVVADSVSLHDERARITTIQARFPRSILQQLNTHGLIAKSTRSHRAVRTHRLVDEPPVFPRQWGSEQQGMVAGHEAVDEVAACRVWADAARAAKTCAQQLADLGVHHQVTNQLLAPFALCHSVLTATDWLNFLRLRIAHDAQPEMQALAECIAVAREASEPVVRRLHLPYVADEEGDDLPHLSAARCARVSYRLPSGAHSRREVDIAFAKELIRNGHMSPFDHPAESTLGRHGRFRGWRSLRKDIPGESLHRSLYATPEWVRE